MRGDEGGRGAAVGAEAAARVDAKPCQAQRASGSEFQDEKRNLSATLGEDAMLLELIISSVLKIKKFQYF